MNYSITDTYKMKREILNFSKKFSAHLSFPEFEYAAQVRPQSSQSYQCRQAD